MVLVLGCLGIAQALFLSIYLLTLKSGNRQANVFLGLVLIGLTIRIGKAVLLNHTHVGPWIRNIGISGFLMVGPSLWLYGRALFEKGANFTSAAYRHLVPFALYLVFSAIIPNNGSLASNVQYVLVQIHLVAYLALSWKLLYKAREAARGQLTSWYLGIVLGVSIIWLTYMGIFVGIIPLYLLGATSFSFLIYIFSFLLLKRHHFVLEKYAASEVDAQTSKQLVAQVRSLFENEAPFLDPETSLKSIAELLEIKPRLLSQAMNENEHMNFSEFVNQYRIKQAKLMLSDPSHAREKIATIAFDCGFGNVTSFNVAFKSVVKMTPSQYKKQYVSQ